MFFKNKKMNSLLRDKVEVIILFLKQVTNDTFLTLYGLWLAKESVYFHRL